RSFYGLVRGDRPSAGDDRHLAVRLLHGNLEDPALLLPRQVKYLARLRVDAEAAVADETGFIEEIPQEPPIRRLVDLQPAIVRQQNRHIAMISDTLHHILHDLKLHDLKLHGLQDVQRGDCIVMIGTSPAFSARSPPEPGSWSRS